MFEPNDNLGDWRIAAATRLNQDLAAAYPGGPSHKAGTPVYQTELIQTSAGEHVGFLTPSATAMAFSIALTASRSAQLLHQTLTYDKVITPEGQGKSVSYNRIGELFNYFEQCMIASTFSFQAIEVYANHTISRNLRNAMEIPRGKKRLLLPPSELERQLSTEEKLTFVLPKICSVPTPKGKQVWEKFKVLKDARDSTIHLKSQNLRAKNETEKGHLFFQFLNIDPISYPKAAEEMIRYFEKENIPRWLSALDIK